MGIKDRVKKAASTVGAGAGRAGRLAQAKVRLGSLKRELDAAEKELGQVALELFERGALQAPALEAPLTRLREAKTAVAAKQAEIAAIKLKGGEEPEAAPGAATEAPDSGAGTESS